MRLSVTPASTLWRDLRDEVRRSYSRGRIVVAVDGEDGAGKARFADNLATVFGEDGPAVFRASIDGQALYLTEARPRAAASAIVDNTDPDAPRRVCLDCC